MTRPAVLVSLLLLGCSKPPVDNDFGELSAPEEPETVAAAEEAKDEAEDPAAEGNKNPFMRNQAPLVEKAAAMEANPRLIETVNRSSSNNYLTAVKDSGFAAASKVTMAYLQNQIETLRAINGDYPDFETLDQSLRDANFQYAGLKPYQMYAYDEAAHKIVLLEDPDMRAEILGE